MTASGDWCCGVVGVAEPIGVRPARAYDFFILVWGSFWSRQRLCELSRGGTGELEIHCEWAEGGHDENLAAELYSATHCVQMGSQM